MSMFSKPPTKKPEPAGADVRQRGGPPVNPGRAPSAREVASHAAHKAAGAADRRQVDLLQLHRLLGIALAVGPDDPGQHLLR